jgi:hypothetical protein
MLRSLCISISFGLVMAATPAWAYKLTCPELCLKRCEIKEPAPGLYRGECQQGCQKNCYRTRAETDQKHPNRN